MSIEQTSPSPAATPGFDLDLYDSLVHKLGRYERKYKVSSGLLARRIDDGTISETLEVRDWLESLLTLRSMTSDR